MQRCLKHSGEQTVARDTRCFFVAFDIAVGILLTLFAMSLNAIPFFDRPALRSTLVGGALQQLPVPPDEDALEQGNERHVHDDSQRESQKNEKAVGAL